MRFTKRNHKYDLKTVLNYLFENYESFNFTKVKYRKLSNLFIVFIPLYEKMFNEKSLLEAEIFIKHLQKSLFSLYIFTKFTIVHLQNLPHFFSKQMQRASWSE